MKSFFYGALSILILLGGAVAWLWLSEPATIQNFAARMLDEPNTESAENEYSKRFGREKSKISVSWGETSYEDKCFRTLDFYNDTAFVFRYKGVLLAEASNDAIGVIGRSFRGFMEIDFTLAPDGRQSEVLKYKSDFITCDKSTSGITIQTLECDLENHNLFECASAIDWGSVDHM